ncbi:MAG: glycosyltransferase family 2 protein [Endomicrobiales bacterium]|nr:glycosyltransferase family 2 protein [Endomicrobiales bacterium]
MKNLLLKSIKNSNAFKSGINTDADKKIDVFIKFAYADFGYLLKKENLDLTKTALSFLDSEKRNTFIKRLQYMADNDKHAIQSWFRDLAWIVSTKRLDKKGIDLSRLFEELSNNGFLNGKDIDELKKIFNGQKDRIINRFADNKSICIYGFEVRYHPVNNEFVIFKGPSLQNKKIPLVVDSPPKVVICILFHRKKEINQLKDLLRSINKNIVPNVEVVILDNGCEENKNYGVFKELSNRTDLRHKLTLIRSDTNLGFDMGQNVVLDYALDNVLADQFITLNCDIRVPENFIRPLQDVLKEGWAVNSEKKEIGVITPVVLDFEDKDAESSTVQFFGFDVMYKNSYLFLKASESGKRLKEINVRTKETDVPPGTAMFMPVKVLREVGFWDNRYFRLGEEIDFVSRLREASYISLVTKDSAVWHMGLDREDGYYLDIVLKYGIRNIFLNMRKHRLPRSLDDVKAFMSVLFHYFGNGIAKTAKLRPFSFSPVKALIEGFVAGLLGNYGIPEIVSLTYYKSSDEEIFLEKSCCKIK